MKLETDEAEVLARTVRWVSGDERVRAALLTSSRVDPRAPRDILSDYDVALVVADVAALMQEARWAEAFGQPLLRVRDTTHRFGLPVESDMVLYADGTKIDYTLWPVSLAARIAEAGALPEDFDGGYRVLLDKDGLTRGWPPPTHSAYLPAQPTEAEFRALIEEFWFVATYVAKYLWRGEFLPARVIFEYELNYLILRRFLEWRGGIDHQWSAPTGFFGKGLQRQLDAETWAEFVGAYTGPDVAASWAALDRAIALFRRLAQGIAHDLGYAYPDALDREMTAYLRQIEELGDRVMGC